MDYAICGIHLHQHKTDQGRVEWGGLKLSGHYLSSSYGNWPCLVCVHDPGKGKRTHAWHLPFAFEIG